MDPRPYGACLVALLAWVAMSCAAPEAAPPTEQLPLQESALAVGGDLEAGARTVAEYALTEEELQEMAAACDDAEGIPLDGDEPCPSVMEFRAGCSASPICLTVFETTESGVVSGYLEVTDTRESGAECGSDPRGVCLRVGLSDQGLERFVTPVPPVTPTGTPAETPTGTPLEPSTATPTPPATPTGPTPSAVTASATP